MIGIEPQYIDALFGRQRSIVIGNTTLRREKVYTGRLEYVSYFGPSADIAFDLLAFESALKQSITCGFYESAEYQHVS